MGSILSRVSSRWVEGGLLVHVLAILFGGGSILFMGTKGVRHWDARRQITTKPDGIMEVVMWLLCTATSWALIYLGSSTQLCWVEAR